MNKAIAMALAAALTCTATLGAQEQTTGLAAGDSAAGGGQRVPLDTAFLGQIETLMAQHEKMEKARAVVKEYEEQMLRQESRLSMESFQPLISGLVMSYTDRKFYRRGTLFRTSGSSAADYGVALLPLAANWVMKAGGVESRSKTRRMLMANSMSLALATGLGTIVKESVGERRPDGSDDKSMPSGHAVVAFTAASILDREYGHLSPWVSVGGYTAATATSVLRLRHNRHWANDVLMGAGIGLTATSLGYAFTDMVLGRQGINPPKLTQADMMRVAKFDGKATSFALVTGTEFGSKTIGEGAYTLSAGGYGGEASVRMSSTYLAGVEGSLFVSPSLALELGLKTSTAKVSATFPHTGDEPVLYGGDLNLYHATLGVKYSVLAGVDRRMSLRAFGGCRYNEEVCLTETEPLEGPGVSLRIADECRAEAGCGFSFDFITTKKFVSGFSCDYVHTFSDLLPNRFQICTTMRIML